SANVILHPPFIARVKEYAYLVGIALVALGVGLAALRFSQSGMGMAMGGSLANGGASTAMAMSGASSTGTAAHLFDTRLADRTISLTASDALRFDPAALNAKVGET